jgi:hypothetical protein
MRDDFGKERERNAKPVHPAADCHPGLDHLADREV